MVCVPQLPAFNGLVDGRTADAKQLSQLGSAVFPSGMQF